MSDMVTLMPGQIGDGGHHAGAIALADAKRSSLSPFHAGERAVQARLGVSGIEDWARKVVRPYMPEEHRLFHTSLPFMIAAARDAGGRPWVTVLTGPDGFITSPDDRTLHLDTRPVPGDALEGALLPGADVGLLGIQPATRRRNRVNGRIAGDGSGAIALAVDQSFGNCPQYIRERKHWHVEGHAPGAPVTGTALSGSQAAWIASADTFFIASGHRSDGEAPSFGMDASHRGGEAGFVTVMADNRIRFPDYAGNNHYNTMGNLVVDPRVGILFIDFSSGSLLQLTGTASIDWDSPAVTAVPGARRLITIDIDEIVELPSALSLRWDADAGSVRSLRLIEKRRESADVTSFVFEARDGGPLPGFNAGQHLPIKFSVPESTGPMERTYSLSGPATGNRYRISVKREPHGMASRYLHDHAEPGAILDVSKPAGAFVLPGGETPVVLISAGVGVTPMVSMLHTLVEENAGRPVHFLHGARDGAHHPLAEEIGHLAGKSDAVHTHIRYSRPRPSDVAGVHFDSEGRIDAAFLDSLNLPIEADYLFCGPPAFMAGLMDALRQRGVPDERLHAETFGPAG